MKSLYNRWFWVNLVALVLVGGRLGAQESAPESSGDAKEVALMIYVLNVQEVDSASQSMLVDFGYRARWNDPRQRDQSDRIRFVPMAEVWHPNLQVEGDLGLRKKAGEILRISPDGTVEQRQRFVGRLSAPMDLSDFPFDRHMLKIHVLEADWDTVRLVANVEESGQANKFTTSEWIFGQGRLHEEALKIPQQEFAGVTYEFEARRRVGYYVWKVMLPLLLIVFMSWAVFYIEPTNLGPQLGAATASMLTLIAYRFSLDHLLPKISYFTRLDWFITGSTVLVFLAMLQAIVTGQLAGEHKALASRIDRQCRWIFPLVFVTLIAFAFLG